MNEVNQISCTGIKRAWWSVLCNQGQRWGWDDDVGAVLLCPCLHWGRSVKKGGIITLLGRYLVLVEEQIYWIDFVALSSVFFTTACGDDVTAWWAGVGRLTDQQSCIFFENPCAISSEFKGWRWVHCDSCRWILSVWNCWKRHGWPEKRKSCGGIWSGWYGTSSPGDQLKAYA